MHKCPVCNKEYQYFEKPGHGRVRFCSDGCWLLKIDSLIGTQLSDPSYNQRYDLLKRIEDWANLKQQELEKYQKQVNELIQERENYKSDLKKLNQQLSIFQSSMQGVTHNNSNDAINTRLEKVENQYNQFYKWSSEWSLKQEKSWDEAKQHFQKLETRTEKIVELESKVNKLSEENQSYYFTVEAQNNEIKELNQKVDKFLSLLEEPKKKYNQGQVESFNPVKDLSNEEVKIINLYQKNNTEVLSRRVTQEVNVTEESVNNYRLGGQKIFLNKSSRGRGKYWIINEGSFKYLVPKKNLTIDQYSYNIIAEALFECKGYQQGRSQQFKVLKPAKVFELPEGEKWGLENKGILEFY